MAPAAPHPESALMACAVRMVVPIRREFGRTLDVMHFLRDAAYALEIVQLAKGSSDARLREYALEAEARLLGPRASGVATPGPRPPVDAEADAASGGPDDETKAKLLARYRSGLR